MQRVKVACVMCGKTVERYVSEIAANQANYCSRKCKGRMISSGPRERHPRWKGGGVDRACLNCGTTFRVELNVIKRGGGKYCSKPCYWARARGDKHWHYNDGRGHAPYANGYTDKVRRQVTERDGKCVDCGQWDDRPRCMQVHHLDGGQDDHSLDNLVLLCVKCHARRHSEQVRTRRAREAQA